MRGTIRRGVTGGMLALVFLLAAGAVPGQEKTSLIPASEEQKMDVLISEMLAAWQIGDAELMHRYYAEDVIVVSGLYEPPVVGWTNYAAAYRQQRTRITSVRLDRRNTYLQIRGNVAWASYQWEFQAQADGRPATAQGHTTLVLEKRGGRWLIVHNHTSMVGQMQVQEPAPEPQPPKPGA
jgi:uncharacterized protein (TIGR02246 family)